MTRDGDELAQQFHALAEASVPLSDIPRAERDMLRPMAETLAMIDGNAFFGVDCGPDHEWWESYVPEAKALFDANGGMSGWAGQASFAKAARP